MKKKNKIKIDIITDNTQIIPEYIIATKNKSKKIIELVEYFENLKNLEYDKKDVKIIDLKTRKKFNNKKTYRKKKFFKKVK